MKEGTGGLRPAEEIPDSEAGATEAAKLAFCPSLFETTGRGLCGFVSCGECRYAPEGQGWLCATCAKTEQTLPYYADGACSKCTDQSIVLSLWKK